jgi:hypothetical protein
MASHSLEPRSILEHGPLISPRDAANLLGVHVNSIRPIDLPETTIYVSLVMTSPR